MSTVRQRITQQYNLDIALRTFATFDTYVCKSESKLLDILISLKDPAQEPRQYFLWGAKESGKSHLLYATCNNLATTELNTIYIPLSKFTKKDSDIIRDIHHLDVVCLDDIDRVLGDADWEMALFRLINELRAANKSIIMTASINPLNANICLPDLASRLVWGPVYKLSTLDDTQKTEALRLQAKARGFDISLEVSRYLITRYSRELKSLIKLLNKIDQQSLAQKRKVTVPFVKTVLDSI